ncbi:alpha/beta hydrolase [Streptosporangium sp. NPDC020072]|uniref:Alpha/beta hydrolase n=1 Tax=Streptosporangium jomthongense TaxID=1193683 RepID=A0ABV8FEE2_9ACTN
MRTAATVSALALAALVIGPVALQTSSAAHASPATLAHYGGASITASKATTTRKARTKHSTKAKHSARKADPSPEPSTTTSASATATSTAKPTPSPTAKPSAGATAKPKKPSATATPRVASTDNPLLDGTVINTVAYGPHPRQRMDVWHQTDGLKRPGVFLIHGGWWSSGDKKYMTAITTSYAEQGYTVFNINYRLSGDAAWPAQRTDALDAIATARRHAALWSFDPNNYVVVGFSAGGHLASAVGTYGDGLPGLRGVVGISPVTSPMLAYEDGATDVFDLNKRKLRESAIQLAGGCEPVKCPKIWASMEVPRHASKGDVPELAVHSQDEFVPAEHSLRLKERLKAVGVSMTVLTEPGSEHSTPMYRLPGVAETVQDWIAGKLL